MSEANRHPLNSSGLYTTMGAVSFVSQPSTRTSKNRMMASATQNSALPKRPDASHSSSAATTATTDTTAHTVKSGTAAAPPPSKPVEQRRDGDLAPQDPPHGLVGQQRADGDDQEED